VRKELVAAPSLARFTVPVQDAVFIVVPKESY